MKPNCENRTVFIGDNREVMLGLNADIADAIITDPPFNTGQMRKDDKAKVDKKKSAELGFLADMQGQAIQHYKDNWKIGDLSKQEKEFIRYRDERLLYFCKIIGDQHSDGMEAYLLMMASRLLMCHRILKETGSIFLHCDPTANGYLRMLMDAIFGQENFRNEIVWAYHGASNAASCFPRKHDTILFYAKSEKAKFNIIPMPMTKSALKLFRHDDGDGRLYKRWRNPDGSIHKTYLDNQPGTKLLSWWSDIPSFMTASASKERCRLGDQKWTDQKPLALYTRLVKAVTHKGDLVIDPFCGCATTLIAAENEGRQWIGIDYQKARAKLIRPQMEKLITSDVLKWNEDFQIITKKKDYPQRTDNRLSDREYDERKEELLKKQTRYEGQNRYYYYCKICEHPFRREYLEIDHEFAKAKGGDNDPKNLQLLCSRCNRRKSSTKTNEDVRKELAAEGLLYHQRAAVYRELTKTSIIDSEAYLVEEENPKSEPRRNRKKAKKVSKRKKNNSQPEMGLGQ